MAEMAQHMIYCQKTKYLKSLIYAFAIAYILLSCQKAPQTEVENPTTQTEKNTVSRSKKCKSSNEGNIFKNFSAGCLGLVCLDSNGCGDIIEFKQDKTFSANALCKGNQFHDSYYTGTWLIESGILYAISVDTTTDDDFCENECEDDLKCSKSCKRDFLRKYGKKVVKRQYAHELIDTGSNRIKMRQIAWPKSNQRGKNHSPEEEIEEWQDMGCIY